MRTKLAPALAALVMLVGGNALAIAITEGSVNAGVGGGAYTGNMGDITEGGFAWDVRGGVGINPFLGAEIYYQGMRNGVATVASPQAGVLRDQELTQTALTVDAVGGVPFLLPNDHTLRPYALVGLGWSRIDSNDQLNAVGLGDDNQVAIPLGLGVSYELTETFLVDGRFTYNFLPGLSAPLAGSDGHSWTALVNVGARLGGM